MTFVPFVFGHGPWLEVYRARIPSMPDCADAIAVDVLSPASVSFFKLMNAANARAFGAIGMPAWVQLDCATLPTAMIGFAVAAHTLDKSVVDDLSARAGVTVNDDTLIPVAEYTALCTPEHGLVTGFSLFSLVPGLGLRAKAMALLVMQAHTQVGITQRDNTALRTHTRLGPLTVVSASVPVHDKPDTLVYSLKVPNAETLTALAVGTRTRVPAGVGARVDGSPAGAGSTYEKNVDDVVAGDVLVDVDIARKRAVLALP